MRFHYHFTAVCILTLVAIGFAAQSEGTIYSATDDFSIAGNPNGVWSYGTRNGSDPSSFVPFNAAEVMLIPIEDVYRWDNDYTSDPSICYNPTSTDYTIDIWSNWNCDAGELVLNPYGSERTGVRWTAPAAGTVEVSATFSVSQGYNAPFPIAYIYGHSDTYEDVAWDSGSSIQDLGGSITFTTPTSYAVAAGDTIDFVISGVQTTGLIATVDFTEGGTILHPGDANRDGKVDGSDVTILAGNWQVLVNATWDMGDFNGDKKVDGSDVTILAGNWQAGVSTVAASVPEPTTVCLLLSLLASLWIWKRVR